MTTDTREARRAELLAELRSIRRRLKMPGLSLSEELALRVRSEAIHAASFAIWEEIAV